jgi:glycosyltransferase involved in cell wall biosynthesis
MKILLVTDKFYVEDGGSYTAVSELSYSLNRQQGVRAKIFHNNNNSFLNISTYCSVIKNFDIIHIFGIWMPFSNIIIYLARKMKKKIIVSTIGYLEPWSLNQSKIKKKIAWNLYQKKFLEICDFIHVTSQQEFSSLLKINLNKVKIFFIRHGKINKIYPEFEISKNKKKKTALFFSRIHKKKGLLELIDAWNSLNPQHWELEITGPISDLNYKKIIEKKLIEYNLEKKIHFSTPVFDEYSKKSKIFSSDLVILPSKNENFGFSICESMFVNRSVLCSSETPWQEINNLRAGFCLPLNSKDEISLALKKIFSLSDDQLSIIGNNAKNYSLLKYDLDNVVIHEYLNFYKSLIA